MARPTLVCCALQLQGARKNGERVSRSTHKSSAEPADVDAGVGEVCVGKAKHLEPTRALVTLQQKMEERDLCKKERAERVVSTQTHQTIAQRTRDNPPIHTTLLGNEPRMLRWVGGQSKMR